jgi:hypothetical protein
VFLTALQASVKAGDKQKVAMMARYPLSVYLNGRHRVIRNPPALLTDYDHIFTASMRKAIIMEAPDCLFANWQGVMIGHGEVWFEEQINGSLEIETLNVPAP